MDILRKFEAREQAMHAYNKAKFALYTQLVSIVDTLKAEDFEALRDDRTEEADHTLCILDSAWHERQDDDDLALVRKLCDLTGLEAGDRWVRPDIGSVYVQYYVELRVLRVTVNTTDMESMTAEVRL